MDVAFFRAWISRAAQEVEAARGHLTRLDAQIGDGDHGVNLSRGFGAVLRTLDTTSPRTPGTVLVLTGTTLISKVGGASGPLYGSAFRRAGQAFPDSETVGLEQVAEGLGAALAAIRSLGAAKDGDKTMVDALSPAVEALNEAVGRGADPVEAFTAMAEAARAGAESTIPMQAHKGRASYLGERSIGHEDPGAASTVLILGALRDVALDPPGGGTGSSGAESEPASESGSESAAEPDSASESGLAPAAESGGEA